MSTEIDTRVTISLHPDNVAQLDGYDEDTAPVLAHVVTAFDEAYLGIGKVHTAREAAKTHPGWNGATQIMETAALADKVFAKAARAMDGSLSRLNSGIAHLEKELSTPVESRASHPVSLEIRAHIKKLPSGQRMSFIKQAIETGDHDTARAALGAPAYLSGLEGGMQQALLRMYHEKAQPGMAKRLKAMTAARDLVATRSGLLHSQIEAAVGLPPHKVQQLRNARTQAEQAFILKDLA